MPKINISLKLSNEQAALLASNQAKLMGLVKSSNTNRIINHVPLTIQAKGGIARQVVGTIIGIGAAILIPVAQTLITDAIKRAQSKRIERADYPIKEKHKNINNKYALA